MVHARHTPTYIPTPPYPHPLTSPHTHTHMHIHTHLEGAFPELLCQCAQGLLNGEGGIHGEGEFGDILQHLQHALLLREKVVEGLRKHQ